MVENIVWSKLKLKLKLLSKRAGRYKVNRVDSLVDESDVNVEYVNAFRTQSYVRLCSKVGRVMATKSLNKQSSSIYLPLNTHLSEFLLEPCQETLTTMIADANIHHLFLNYCETSLEATDICGLLLGTVHQIRGNHRLIERVIKQTETMDYVDYSDDQFHDIFRDLSEFVLVKNPLSTISPNQFNDIHNTHNFLYRRLRSKRRKIRRRVKLVKLCKKTISRGICLITCSFVKQVAKTSSLERIDEQLDVAARGIFTLTISFDTMSRLVKRLNDEIENFKYIADTCVRNGNNKVMLKIFMRDLGNHEMSFFEQLEELEKQIYLCLLSIKRSRMQMREHLPSGSRQFEAIVSLGEINLG